MFGSLYLLFILTLGFIVQVRVFPEPYFQNSKLLSTALRLGVGFLLASIPVVIVHYICLFLFVSLGFGAEAAKALAAIVIFLGMLWLIFLGFRRIKLTDYLAGFEWKWNESMKMGLCLFGFVCIWTFFAKSSLSESGDLIVVGKSIYWDFIAHMSMIRSFSEGLNIPTEYFAFTNEKVRYHFMIINFFPGVLEYLGMSLGTAFNSIFVLYMFSLISVMLVALPSSMRRPEVLLLVILFFFFRGSTVGFSHLSVLLRDGYDSFLGVLPVGDLVLGQSFGEDWGLYTQKIYLNQRHLVPGLGLWLLAIATLMQSHRYRLMIFLTVCCTFANVLIAIVMGASIALYFLVQKKWKELAVYISLSVPICFIIISLYGAEGGSAVGYYFGYLANPPSLLNAVKLFYQLIGPVSLLLATIAIFKGTFAEKNFSFYLLLFMLPALLLCFLFRFSHSLEVNHKFINLIQLGFAVLAAIGMCQLLLLIQEVGKYALQVLCYVSLALLLFFGIWTGVLDGYRLYKMDSVPHIWNQGHQMTNWLKKNTAANSVLLTDPNELISPAQLAGRRLYLGGGWYSRNLRFPYDLRLASLNELLQKPNGLVQFLKEEGISGLLLKNQNFAGQKAISWQAVLKRVYCDTDRGYCYFEPQ